jgi:hypothetical protein
VSEIVDAYGRFDAAPRASVHEGPRPDGRRPGRHG